MDERNYYQNLVSNGVSPNGLLSTELLGIVKQSTPVFCVDVILVPEAVGPEAILFWRSDKESANPNRWWISGGKQRLGESMERTAERKVLSETGIELQIKPEDQLFAYDIIHKKKDGIYYTVRPEDLSEDVRGLYHTPSVCYLARLPPFSEIERSISARDGHNKFRLFTKITKDLDPYIRRAMTEAWKRLSRI